MRWDRKKREEPDLFEEKSSFTLGKMGVNQQKRDCIDAVLCAILSYTIATPQATPHAEQILTFCMTARTRNEIAEYFGVKDPKFFAKKHIKPLLESGALRMTMPNKPTSPAQKYVTVKKNKM